MFIKFKNKLVDVSNCYFEQDKTLNTEGDTNIEEHRIMCCAMKQESIDEEVYLLVESYPTQAEADKRFAELESILCQNRESQMFMMFDSIIKMQKCLMEMQRVFNAFITKSTNSIT